LRLVGVGRILLEIPKPATAIYWLELLGRPQADETLVAMMAAFEIARGPFPRAKPISANADLATLGIPD
jgi:hypothetical protein